MKDGILVIIRLQKVLNGDLYPKDDNVSNDYKIHQGKFKYVYTYSYI